MNGAGRTSARRPARPAGVAAPPIGWGLGRWPGGVSLSCTHPSSVQPAGLTLPAPAEVPLPAPILLCAFPTPWLCSRVRVSTVPVPAVTPLRSPPSPASVATSPTLRVLPSPRWIPVRRRSPPGRRSTRVYRVLVPSLRWIPVRRRSSPRRSSPRRRSSSPGHSAWWHLCERPANGSTNEDTLPRSGERSSVGLRSSFSFGTRNEQENENGQPLKDHSTEKKKSI